MQQLKKAIVITFNKYYNDFINDIKEYDCHLEKKINENADNFSTKSSSNANITFFRHEVTPQIVEFVCNASVDNVILVPLIQDMCIVEDLPVREITNRVDPSNYANIVLYLYNLVLFVTLYDLCKEVEKGPTAENDFKTMYDNVMSIMKCTEAGVNYDSIPSTMLTKVTDQRVVAILRAISKVKQSINVSDTKPEPQNYDADDEKEPETETETEANVQHDTHTDPSSDSGNTFENILSNTKLGKFTQDLFADALPDVSEVKDMNDLLKPEVLGNILSKTASHLKQKQVSGEFTNQDLLKDCAQIMNMLGNSSFGNSSTRGSPFNVGDLQNIMNLFGKEDKFKVNGSDPIHKTQERLRKQLEQNKQNKL